MRILVVLLLTWLPIVHGRSVPEKVIIVNADSSHQPGGDDEFGAQMAHLTYVMEQQQQATAELTQGLYDLTNAIQTLTSFVEKAQEEADIHSQDYRADSEEYHDANYEENANKGQFRGLWYNTKFW